VDILILFVCGEKQQQQYRILKVKFFNSLISTPLWAKMICACLCICICGRPTDRQFKVPVAFTSLRSSTGVNGKLKLVAHLERSIQDRNVFACLAILTIS
jgi:hypothetical protein